MMKAEVTPLFCDTCGVRIEGTASFCPSCGRNFSAPAVRTPTRVARHLKIVGILWLVRAGMRLFKGLFLASFFSYDWGFWDGVPPFVPGLVRGIGGFLLLTAIVGAVAGWGLLERRPWARMLAIVLGVLALFDIPFGTALGIYTLWVLAPSSSEAEYRAIARPA
jgi:hypothetical protein